MATRSPLSLHHYIARHWFWNGSHMVDYYVPPPPPEPPVGIQVNPDPYFRAWYERPLRLNPGFYYSTLIVNQSARPTLPTVKNTVSIKGLISASQTVSLPEYSSTVSIPVNVVDVAFPMATNSPQSRLNRDGLYSA